MVTLTDNNKTNDWIDNMLSSYNGYLRKAAALYAGQPRYDRSVAIAC